MFKIDVEPTFPATLTIIGQGREQKLAMVFKHMDADEYGAMLKDLSEEKVTIEEAILRIVDNWEADAPLNRESIAKLRKKQPGADWAILTGYADALRVARKGN